jgi:RND superfamily putative drug exporter
MVLANADQAAAVATTLKSVEGVASVADPVTRGGRSLINATLTAAPDSEAATTSIDRIRAAIADVPGADAIAGGDTATRADTLRASADDNLRIIPLILGVVLLILVLLLRAVTAPLILIGTVVLSYGAALGLSALIFRHVLGFAGEDTSFPLYVFVFLVALGIDYNIFLMTRVREESLAHGTREGILRGLVATGGVITSAGIVLAATFAALGVLPVLFLAQIAFIVAIGVLIDTVIVRSLLVPALGYDIGRKIWWPSRLSRD